MWISGSWILNKESDFWNGLDNETAGLFLVMNWLLKKVEFHLLLSCLLESGLSYGLDDWRRKVIVTAMVLMIEGGCFFCYGLDNWRRMVSSVMGMIGWLNSEEVKCWWW